MAGPPTGALLLQGLWDHVRPGQEDALRSPHLAACFALLTHVLLCAPFLAMDALGLVCQRVRSWRIDPAPPLQEWSECFSRILYRYVTVVLPVTALHNAVRSPDLPEEAPSCRRLLVEVAACLLLFDALFFAWHYCMHRVPWLYRSIHRLHHQRHSPFALAAQDTGTVEFLSQLLLALGSVQVVGCHPLSELAFHLLNTWLAVEDHCGYRLPWAADRLLPCLGGAPHHQIHHRVKSRNYAPYFTHWDHLFGTYQA
ncbi:cholesterol 25-hydroxylase [Pholidichthys leucotaenia]